jgi:hypothetical protein
MLKHCGRLLFLYDAMNCISLTSCLLNIQSDTGNHCIGIELQDLRHTGERGETGHRQSARRPVLITPTHPSLSPLCHSTPGAQ